MILNKALKEIMMLNKNDGWFEKFRKIVALVCISLSGGIFAGAFVGGAFARYVLKLDEDAAFYYFFIPITILVTLIGIKGLPKTLENHREGRQGHPVNYWISRIMVVVVISVTAYCGIKSDIQKKTVSPAQAINKK